MKNLLEELWYSYDMTDTNENEEQRSELLGLIVRNEDKLKETLNEKEMDTLTKLENCIQELNDLSQKEAFIKGVRFAASFMCEALGFDS
ncbi:MAG: hypothetical protein E7635_01225 [Ruminococcaceae bacterium]|nr:hypothetical protein [Oscillospiraceae bacterium]